MLSSIRIKNFAIIQETEVSFAPGLNVLTGETGAGKSVILKAIGLLIGQRASSELVRRGTDKAVVEGLFILSEEKITELRSINDDMESIIDDEELIIKRVLEANGRGKVYLNGNFITSSTLSLISTSLIEITGQHHQQSLLNTSGHIDLLDTFGVKPDTLESNAKLFHEFALARKNLQEFRNNRQQLEAKFEQISFEFEELSKANLRSGQREELERIIAKSSNVETLGENISECLDLLSSTDSSIEQGLRKCGIILEQCSSIDSSLNETAELFESSRLQLEDVRFSLEQYASSLELNPEVLELHREQLTELARLSRKFNKSEDELISYQDELEKEINSIQATGFDEKKLSEQFETTRKALDVSESKLRKERQKAAKLLQDAVESALADLEMKKAKFGVEMESCQSSPNGADEVKFILAANPGEGFRELAKVASGGELSRVLLSLKTILSTKSTPNTQIFDEIDSGIGGQVARTVGLKLRKVSRNSQVILITHSPQIASLADRHLLVEKQSVHDRTISAIKEVEGSARVEQIASMMGAKGESKEFEASARELLKSC